MAVAVARAVALVRAVALATVGLMVVAVAVAVARAVGVMTAAVEMAALAAALVGSSGGGGVAEVGGSSNCELMNSCNLRIHLINEFIYKHQLSIGEFILIDEFI